MTQYKTNGKFLLFFRLVKFLLLPFVASFGVRSCLTV
jgi:hypothetical protein